MAIYKIAINKGYLTDIAAQIYQNWVDILPELTIYLPTRRACRFLQEELVRLSSKDIITLPNIIPLDEYEIASDGEYSKEYFNNNANRKGLVSRTEQNLFLTRLIFDYPEFEYNMAQASSLAKSLASLFDEFAASFVELEKLKELEIFDSATHWQKIYDFLKFAYYEWQAYLDNRNLVDHATYRNINLGDKISAINANPEYYNKAPIIIAGTTGSIKIVAKFIKKIASLENGYVILPPLDFDIHAPEFGKLQEYHLGYHIQQLLKYCETAIDELEYFNPQFEEIYKNLSISEIIASSLSLHSNAVIKNKNLKNLEQVELIELESDYQHLIALSLLIKQQIEKNKDVTIGLITNNNSLIEGVQNILASQNLALDNSLGVSLVKTKKMSFLCDLAELCLGGFNYLQLISILKNDLLPQQFKILSFKLEQEILRDIEIIGGLPALKAEILQIADLELMSWFNDFCQKIEPLLAYQDSAFVNFNDLLSAHIKIAESLLPNFWQDECGEQIGNYLAKIFKHVCLLKEIEPANYLTILQQLAAPEIYREKQGWNPQIAAINPIEARLLSFDVVILADLNEGCWPLKLKHDPWLNNAMRKELGLTTYEENLSKSAHDFYIAMLAPKIFITRSLKSGGSEVSKSRFLIRFINYIHKITDNKKLQNLKPEYDWPAYIEQLRIQPAEFVRSDDPAKLPAEKYNKIMAATTIEMLIRNPYGYYAKKILELNKLDDFQREPNQADFGIFLHDVFDYYASNLAKELKNIAKKEQLLFLASSVAQLEEINDNDLKNYYSYQNFNLQPSNLMQAPFHYICYLGVKFLKIHNQYTIQLWWPKFLRIAKAFIIYHHQRLPDIKHLFLEQRGQAFITAEANGNKANFCITARADRTEISNDDVITIMDYKTGQVPSGKDVNLGIAPQLLVTALIIAEGGFKAINQQLGLAEKAKLYNYNYKMSYVKIAATSPYIKEHLITKDDLLNFTKQGLVKLFSAHIENSFKFISNPSKNIAPKYNDFLHLAREE